MLQRVLACATWLLLIGLLDPLPATAYPKPNDLTQLTLEDLMNIEVYSAAKKPVRYFDTAAAIYVITPEDIRRSGANSIPELLRMVPGVHVQQVDSNTWDISARGFNGSIFANKLLVLIDGRSVYTPLYGGVFWDVQDVVLEDIARIEVIRGPGGALWGANAVNGVINIITKKAKDTQGTLIVAGAGTEGRFFSTGRYGGQTGDWYYRTYGKYFNRDEGYSPDGTEHDAWEMARAGFRTDNADWTVQGDFYHGRVDQRIKLISFSPTAVQTVNDTIDVQGGNLLARYEQEDWLLQMYWDMTERDSRQARERRNKIDVEYMRRWQATDNQEISWGSGYRLEMEDIADAEVVMVTEPGRADQLLSFFLQDHIQVMDGRLHFILGSKFEYNIYTHLEVQPNARILYNLNDKQVIWAAVSRAVRTPSRIEVDGEITVHSSVVGPARTMGNSDLSAEELLSFEVGYRQQPRENVLLDIALFANRYEDLITFDFGPTITDRGAVLRTLPTVNGMDGEVFGVEVSADTRLTEWWQLKGAYTFTELFLHLHDDVTDVGLENSIEENTPHHSAYLRSSFDLPAEFAFDTTLRYANAFTIGHVPSILELDVRLSKTIDAWTFSLVGTNLIKDHHPESLESTATGIVTEVERAGYIKVTREF